MNEIKDSDIDLMFYHAIETDYLSVLYVLLKKTLMQSKKSIVYVDSLKTAQSVSDFLWKKQDDFILPHGLVCEDMPQRQPILITYHAENLNHAEYIFFLGHVQIDIFSQFTRYVVIFDDDNQEVKAHIRQQYKILKEKKYKVSYYQQQNEKWQKLQ